VVVLDEQESHSGLVLASWLNGRQGSILLENMILIPLKMLTNTTDAKKNNTSSLVHFCFTKITIWIRIRIPNAEPVPGSKFYADPFEPDPKH
jgi:hypothetical protein